MKKVSPRRLRLQIRRAQRLRIKEGLLSRQRRHRLRRRRVKTTWPGTVRHAVRAPKTMLARNDDDRGALLGFINRVDRHLREGHRVHLDLSRTEHFHPCGTLMFLSRLEIWLSAYPGRLTGTYPGNERSEELLQHVGALRRLGLRERRNIQHENVKFWHFFSASIGDASIYQPLTQSVLDNIEHPQGLLFGDCLNEAVSNIMSHAYGFEMKGLPSVDQRKWWMLSQVKNKEVFVAIYDWGVSIPHSLRRKPELMDFLKLRRWKDARLIEAAASSLRTSTKLPHRGKGLPEMVEFSKNLASGGLSISSGRGAYVYHAEANRFQRLRFKRRMPGTLVLWELPFREEPQNAHINNDIDS